MLVELAVRGHNGNAFVSCYEQCRSIPGPLQTSQWRGQNTRECHVSTLSFLNPALLSLSSTSKGTSSFRTRSVPVACVILDGHHSRASASVGFQNYHPAPNPWPQNPPRYQLMGLETRQMTVPWEWWTDMAHPHRPMLADMPRSIFLASPVTDW